MKRLLSTLASICLLMLASGCGIPETMSQSTGSYPSPECTMISDGAHTRKFSTYVVPSSIAEAQDVADLVVEGTITEVGRFTYPPEQKRDKSPAITILRHYMLQVDTYYKGQGKEQLDVLLAFNSFLPGDCPVDEHLLEENFYPGEDPQFEAGKRYLLSLTAFPEYCEECYAIAALPSVFHIRADGSLEMLLPADAELAVSQSLQLDNRPLRDQVDEALQQLSSSPSK